MIDSSLSGRVDVKETIRLRNCHLWLLCLKSEHCIQLAECYVTKIYEYLTQLPMLAFLLLCKCFLDLRLFQIAVFAQYLTYQFPACWIHFNLLVQNPLFLAEDRVSQLIPSDSAQKIFV